MKRLYSLLALAGSFSAAAQSEKDSLFNLVRTLPEDTSKINVYYQYGYIYENINLDSAAYFFKKAKAIADKHNHIKGQIRFASYYSDVLNYRGDLEGSYKVNKEALDLALKHGLPLETAKCYTNVGNVFNHQGRYDSAAYYYTLATAAFEKINESRYLNIVYQNLGNVFYNLKQYPKALEYADKSIVLSRKLGDSFSVGSVLINKAGALSRLKHYPESIQQLQQAEKIAREIDNPYMQELTAINFGNVYSHTKEFTKAIEYYQSALAITRKQGFRADEGTALNGMAMALSMMGRHTEADAYIQQAIGISRETGVFFDLSSQYKLASEIKAKLNQYPQAYNYLLQYLTLNDSLTNASVSKTVQELEKKYETARKDKAIADQQLLITKNEHELRQKQTWLFVSVAIAAVLVIISLVSYRNYRNKRKLQEQRIISLQKEAEMIRLKATLEGQQEERQRIAKEIHDDIGSGLTSIVFLSNTTGNNGGQMDKIGSTARNLVNQMNEIVWSMSTDQDSLEDLVAYIRHNIGEMLNVVDMEYVFNIPDEIPDIKISGAQRRNIYLAVKEAVHNCIKHARATLVTITLNFSHGLMIRIEDNVIGIQQEVVRKFGNGMKNMQHRMEKTGGSFRIVRQQPLALEMKLPPESIL